MKKILTILTLSTLVYANSISIDSIGLNIGSSSMDYSQKNYQGTILLGDEPNKSFISVELYTILNPIMDISKKYNMKPYLSYSYSSNSDLKHQYILTGLNKYYSYKQSSLYAGVLLGYGQLDWKYDPLNSSTYKNVDANSFIGGIQVGVDYPIHEKFSLGLNAKYLLHDYKTDLKPSSSVSSTIEHDRTSSISLAVKYSF